ncbi:MAG: hydroxymethylglutaryl-CoA lyase [Candidatus Dormibacteraeota bacterium]|nr:hydroxymethylglutaryl-CoA lyase [Candidatus Dormibacteraeota bacterium]
MTGHVRIREVGPRDGLQNESKVLAADVRAELIQRLAATGVPEIEAVSFVRPDLVPAMAEPEAVLDLSGDLGPHPPVVSGLVLNQRGYERALAAGLRDLHYAFPVTDTFARRNQNSTTDAGLALAQTLIRRARADGARIDVGFICAFGCPFEGPVPVSRVLGLAERLMEEPPDSVTVADTIGVGVPTQATALVKGLLPYGRPVVVHLHNTRNTGLANAYAAVEAGASGLDASVGGAGGCPFAPRATGNVATEDVVYLLRGLGVETGISLDGMIETAHWLEAMLGKQLPSMLARAGDFTPVA